MMPRGWGAEQVAARLEDLQWLADTGENAHGAAHRLGLTHHALERWVRRHDEVHEVWQRLTARDPTDHNDQRSCTWRRSA